MGMLGVKRWSRWGCRVPRRCSLGSSGPGGRGRARVRRTEGALDVCLRCEPWGRPAGRETIARGGGVTASLTPRAIAAQLREKEPFLLGHVRVRIRAQRESGPCVLLGLGTPLVHECD